MPPFRESGGEMYRTSFDVGRGIVDVGKQQIRRVACVYVTV